MSSTLKSPIKASFSVGSAPDYTKTYSIWFGDIRDIRADLGSIKFKQRFEANQWGEISWRSNNEADISRGYQVLSCAYARWAEKFKEDLH